MEISLREYVDRRFEDSEKAVQAALAAAEKAVAKAEANAEKWRENANEWRGAMSDRERSFMTRMEFNSYRDATEKIIDGLKVSRDVIAGQTDGKDKTWAVIVTIIGVGIAIIGFLGLK